MNNNNFVGISDALKEYLSDNEPYIYVQCNGMAFDEVYIWESENCINIDVTEETSIHIEKDNVSFWSQSPLSEKGIELDKDIITDISIEEDVVFIKTTKGFYVNVYLD